MKISFIFLLFLFISCAEESSEEKSFGEVICSSEEIKQNDQCYVLSKACEVDNVGSGIANLIEGTPFYTDCQMERCEEGYILANQKCNEIEKSCRDSVGQGRSVFNEDTQEYNECVYESCFSDYQFFESQCYPKIKDCSVGEGRGFSYLLNAPDQYSSCSITSCSEDYFLKNGSCLPKVASCLDEDGEGVKRYDVGLDDYAPCNYSYCNSKTLINGRCLDQTLTCPINIGTGTQNLLPDGSYTECYYSACVEGYTLFESNCFENQISCSILNGEGLKFFSNGNYSECQAQSCIENYTLFNNECLVNSRNCQDITGEGIENLLGDGSYSECSKNLCFSNYSLFESECFANQISCDLSIGEGYQQFNNGTYLDCFYSACSEDYEFFENTCIVKKIACEEESFYGFNELISPPSNYSECRLDQCKEGYLEDNGICKVKSIVTVTTDSFIINQTNEDSFSLSGTCDTGGSVYIDFVSNTYSSECVDDEFEIVIDFTKETEGTSFDGSVRYVDSLGLTPDLINLTFTKDTEVAELEINPFFVSYIDDFLAPLFNISGTCSNNEDYLDISISNVLRVRDCTTPSFSESIDLTDFEYGEYNLNLKTFDENGNENNYDFTINRVDQMLPEYVDYCEVDSSYYNYCKLK